MKEINFRQVLLVEVAFAAACVFSPAAHAAKGVAGTYHCVSVQAGKAAETCPTTPLVLNRDGTYRLWLEVGTYKVAGRFVLLSESKKRGPGQFHGRNTIVFEYYSHQMRHTVTFERTDLPKGWKRA